MTKQLGWESPPNMPIAEGDNTPDPGIAGVEIWSTVSNKKLVWSGGYWISAMDLVTDAILTSNNDTTKPVADTLKLIRKKIAGMDLLTQISLVGEAQPVQNNIWKNKIALWSAPGSVTTVPGVLGFPAFTAVGTATARAVAATNTLTRMRRIGYVSANGAGSLASLRVANAQYSTGDGFGTGGFFLAITFAFADATIVSGARGFVGVTSNTAAPTNVQPSTLTNSIGVAQLSTSSTQLYLVYGGSVAQAAIPLGAGFPPTNGAGAINGMAYTLVLYAPTNESGNVYYHLFKLNSATEVSGKLTCNTLGVETPNPATLLTPAMWRCNNATAAAVGMDISNIYMESDF
jgi:hypothetical protein